MQNLVCRNYNLEVHIESKNFHLLVDKFNKVRSDDYLSYSIACFLLFFFPMADLIVTEQMCTLEMDWSELKELPI